MVLTRIRGMEKLFSVPLKGGTITDVYTCSPDDVERTISSYPSSLSVFDDNTAKAYGKSIDSMSLILPHGEEHKNWASIDSILAKAIESGLARDSVFFGIGGGVILDMTAFAASIYMRGARCVLVPTTLLSAVDATLGGKTGIDYGGAKNTVGTFFPSESVLICTELLKTLPESEYRSGLGEVLKHALLSGNAELWNFLIDNKDKVLSRDGNTVSEMIRLSLEVKISYITRDPEEKKGIRSALNLGHTFGHALESLYDYGISHGEGVAWGVVRALEAGEAMGITSHSLSSSASELFRLYGFDEGFRIPEDLFGRYFKAIGKDKKKKSGEVRFVLLEGQGRPVLKPIDEDLVRRIVTKRA